MNDFDEIHARGVQISRELRGKLLGEVDGPSDAFRHAVNSAEATLRYGDTISHLATRAYEVLNRNQDPRSEEMDHHNNAVGRRLAKKHGNMDGVINEVTEMIEKGSNKDGLVWIDGTKPKDMPEGWQYSTREVAKSAYPDSMRSERSRANREAREHNRRENVVDDDDLEKAKKHASTAKVTPDSDDLVDMLIEEIFMKQLQLYFASIPDTALDRIDAMLVEGLPNDVFEQLVLQFLRENSGQSPLVLFDLGDDNNEEAKRKILEAIRARAQALELELQPRWSDPPKTNIRERLDADTLRDKVQKGGGMKPVSN